MATVKESIPDHGRRSANVFYCDRMAEVIKNEFIIPTAGEEERTAVIVSPSLETFNPYVENEGVANPLDSSFAKTWLGAYGGYGGSLSGGRTGSPINVYLLIPWWDDAPPPYIDLGHLKKLINWLSSPNATETVGNGSEMTYGRAFGRVAENIFVLPYTSRDPMWRLEWKTVGSDPRSIPISPYAFALYLSGISGSHFIEYMRRSSPEMFLPNVYRLQLERIAETGEFNLQRIYRTMRLIIGAPGGEPYGDLDFPSINGFKYRFLVGLNKETQFEERQLASIQDECIVMRHLWLLSKELQLNARQAPQLVRDSCAHEKCQPYHLGSLDRGFPIPFSRFLAYVALLFDKRTVKGESLWNSEPQNVSTLMTALTNAELLEQAKEAPQ